MRSLMKQSDPDATLRAFIARFPTKRAAAQALGVSWSYLYGVLHGFHRPSDAVLAKLGLERVVIQRRKAS